MESTIYTVAGREFELQHYGVKGMKWGRRKAREEYKKLDKARSSYRLATKNYNRAKSAMIKDLGGRNPYTGKWYAKAEQQYKETKQAYKDQKKNVRANTTIGQKSARAITSVLKTVGPLYYADLALTGGATTRAAVKAGKAAVKSALSKVGDQMFDYSILDKDGKVLRRYN